jgi:hypothetical protein
MAAVREDKFEKEGKEQTAGNTALQWGGGAQPLERYSSALKWGSHVEPQVEPQRHT